MSTMEEKIQVLQELQKRVARSGGQTRVEAQHKKGKLTARERIEKLLDPGSFQEIFSLGSHDFSLAKQDSFGDAVVTGHGKIDGRIVCLYAQDATIKGGSVGLIHRFKICHIIDEANEMGVPLIALNDSAGERIQKEMQMVHWSNFFSHTRASGKIPMISAILGNCAGNVVYGAALTDFVFMVDGISHMTITGPRGYKAAVTHGTSAE